MDSCARGLKAAAAMLENGELEAARTKRYAGWDAQDSAMMLKGGLADCYELIMKSGVSPEPQSGQQERLENVVNRFV
jgi:xylose isomerase